jgi:uncharacterized protein (DUF1499 family)
MNKKILWFSLFILGNTSYLHAQGANEMKDHPIKDCPDTPNCVSTKASNPKAQIRPIPYKGELAKIEEALKQVLKEMPRHKLEKSNNGFFHIVSSTKLLKFKDDVHLYYDQKDQHIHIRSASRLGYSDMGVNRKRVEKLKKLLKKYL